MPEGGNGRGGYTQVTPTPLWITLLTGCHVNNNVDNFIRY
jgi:hypothetical protein